MSIHQPRNSSCLSVQSRPQARFWNRSTDSIGVGEEPGNCETTAMAECMRGELVVWGEREKEEGSAIAKKGSEGEKFDEIEVDGGTMVNERESGFI